MNNINNLIDIMITFVENGGYLFGFLLVLLESIFPWLPLFVFIALNIKSFGFLAGFIISWSAAIVGCVLSYFLFKYLLSNKVDKYINKKEMNKLISLKKTIKKISFPNLVLIIALPFSPAFLINIVCGITNVKFKKFFLALLIGKLSIVYFWGFIGTSLIDSITDPEKLIQIFLILIIVFLLSKAINKKYNID
ncbi:MAG: TVP38/TMEM64 family protein [Bacilli bacterium]|nr:TVP38/TMEM64 family protein [Bacilli bacterium]